MKLFLAASYDDANYLRNFGALVRSRTDVAVKFTVETPTMYHEFLQWCKKYDTPDSPLDAVVITNQVTLEFVLREQTDYRPPNTRKGITLNDYQGSILDVSIGNRTIPALVLNPLEHLVTVPYGKFLAERFLSKIVHPERWLPDIEFKWKEVTLENCDDITNRILGASILAVDIETPTTGEWYDLRGINCVGYGCLFREAGTYTIECYVYPFADWSWGAIHRINNSDIPKVTQNGLYDNLYFLRWGLPVSAWYWDTYHLFHSWLAELPKDLALVSACTVRKIRYWKDDGKSGDIQDYYRYNARDCWATLCSLLGILHDCPDWAVTNYVEHEFPVIFPAIHCEVEGIRVDKERFDDVAKDKYREKMEELLDIQEMVGSPKDTLPLKKKLVKGVYKDAIVNFNPNSPDQVAKVFELLGCGSLGSTDKAATLKARAAHPLNDRIIGAISEWKESAKLLSNYLVADKLWEISSGNYRLFYKLDPAGTDTGRLASKASSFWYGFQIQNIPRGDTIKQCLVADDGWLLGEGDYAQSEARCVGYLSGETALIELVESPHDYHSWNAAKFFGVPYESIYDESTGKTLNKPLRDLSKRTNHGANYNMGPGAMLDTMGPKYVADAKRLLKLSPKLPLKEVCKHLLDVYERTYPMVKRDWYASIVKTISVSGFLVSPLGWTRKFFGKPADSKQHLNAAVAHGPQNLSVGIINKCFVRIWKDTVYGDLRGRARLKAQIHDSILFQYRSTAHEVPGIIRDRMRMEVAVTDCVGVSRRMSIPPDMSAGKVRWSELK